MRGNLYLLFLFRILLPWFGVQVWKPSRYSRSLMVMLPPIILCAAVHPVEHASFYLEDTVKGLSDCT